MTPKKAQHQSVIDAPKQVGKFTLYPLTLGLGEWLTQRASKNKFKDGEVSLSYALELCFAFTLPSIELCAMTPAKINSEILKLKHSITPEEYAILEGHAMGEINKREKTAVVPKKKATPPRQKVKR
jgi:hypothetical protein